MLNPNLRSSSEYEAALQSKDRLVMLGEENPYFIGFFDEDIHLYKKRRQSKR
jgi:hypothetical protein